MLPSGRGNAGVFHGTVMTTLPLPAFMLLLKATRRWPEELRKAQEEAKNLASEAQERAANVGETVSEGARNLVDKARGE